MNGTQKISLKLISTANEVERSEPSVLRRKKQVLYSFQEKETGALQFSGEETGALLFS